MSDPQLSGAAKSAGYFLADYHRNVTGLAYPSCKTLARRIGVSVRAAQEAIRVLRTRGWIKLVESHRGPGQSNLYALNWGNTIEPSQIRQHKKKGANKENTNSSAGHANDPSAPNTNESSDNSSYSFLLENPLKNETACKTDPGHKSYDPAGPNDTGVFKPTKINQTIVRQRGTVEAHISEAGNNFAPPRQSQKQQEQEALGKLKQWVLQKEEAKLYRVEFSEYRRFQDTHDKAVEVASPMTLFRISEEAQRKHDNPADKIRYMIEQYEAILRSHASGHEQKK